MTENRKEKHSGSDNSIDEYSRLKIMLALFEPDLTYSQLQKETKLANNTLVKRLSDLREGGIITEHLRRSSATSKPVVAYSISKKWKTRLEELKATIDEMKLVEVLCKKAGESYKQKVAEITDPRESNNLADKYTTVITDSMIVIVIRGLLYKSENPPWNSFVATQTLSIAGQAVWGSAIVPDFEVLSREALKRGSENALERIKKEVNEIEDGGGT